ncbi:putative Multidrug resistance protein MdtH [Streptomyces afghaniensis 772]|uniref:Putative Multidrug resistance protein MdtH n=1 Tax=Streptomyces afghaniensis 772 TaxID=1283301 RepID=S4N9X3_9ACTN|nr:putative Multidrug resistance protein MdtH [Streptomyces afghaniensis 772]
MTGLISRVLARRAAPTSGDETPGGATPKAARESTWRLWQDLSPLLRLLIVTQLAFNIGFYAVLPFLAEHLGTAIGMAGWLVGFVLGLRTFSQQGLFVVGGSLVDRYGVRPVVLAGCVLRIAGFAWLGYAEASWTVIGAVLVIGFAAALFSPAVESEVARQAVVWEEEGHGSRTRLLGLFSVAGQAGAFVGPLLGALLLAVDFRTACLAGAAVFVLVLAGHVWLMPQHIPGRVRVREGAGRACCCATAASWPCAARTARTFSPTTSCIWPCRTRCSARRAPRRRCPGCSPCPRCWWCAHSCR